jgi:hypothetical protein
MIGGEAPSIYLPKIQKKAKIAEVKMDEILQSHLIPPDCLRADDFYSFLQAREKSILDRIEKVMGKSSVPQTNPSAESEDIEPFEYDEDGNIKF